MEILKYRNKLEISSAIALIGCLGGGAIAGNEGAIIVGLVAGVISFFTIK